MKLKRPYLYILIILTAAIITLISCFACRDKENQITAEPSPEAIADNPTRVITQAQEESDIEADPPSPATQNTAIPTLTSTRSQPSPSETVDEVQSPTSTAITFDEPTDTQVPTSTPTRTAVPTQTSTPTASEIYTPVDWTGKWTAFFGDEGGLLFRADLFITREGNTITGVHSTQIFTGTLSEDGLSILGTWVNPPVNGTFSWSIVGENQFCGNTDGDFAYCAARNGASRPDPCICIVPKE
jgi:hypothetical protein